MKRTLWIMLYIFAAGLLAGQSLKVTSPAKGDTWKAGTRYAITWNSSGNVDPNVNIVLLSGGSKVRIKTSAPNNGSYPWDIPATLQPGTYQIRLVAPTTNVRADSDPFSIVAASAPPPGKQFIPPRIDPPLQQLPPATVPTRPLTLSDYAPRIKDFTPKQTRINQGDTLAISVHVENAAQAKVIEVATGKLFPLALRNSAFQDNAWTMKPDRSGDIKLVAENGIQKAEKSFAVTVIPAAPPPPPGNPPVIDKFEVIPKVAKPGEATYFALQYRNATKGIIYQLDGKVKHEVTVLSDFRDFTGQHSFNAAHGTGTYSLELMLSNEHGSTLAYTSHTIRPELKIHYFKANAKQFRSGDEIIFSYSFEGASEAIIKKMGDEDSRKNIGVCAGKNCQGTFSFDFRGPGTYKLCVKNSYDPIVWSPDIVLTQIQ